MTIIRRTFQGSLEKRQAGETRHEGGYHDAREGRVELDAGGNEDLLSEIAPTILFTGIGRSRSIFDNIACCRMKLL